MIHGSAHRIVRDFLPFHKYLINWLVFKVSSCLTYVFILWDPKANVNMCVTCRADCIRLLAGRGLLTAVSYDPWAQHSNPHPVYSKHRELLQSGNPT
jgi:hypothetical protein